MSGGRPKPGSRRSAPSWPRCPPTDRLSAFFGFLGVAQASWARNFPPFLALLGLAYSTSPVVAPYLSLIRHRRAGGLPTDFLPYGLDSAMSTAAAVTLGATELVPTLIGQLDARHDAFVAAGRDIPISTEDGREFQDVLAAMDYLAALSIGWLHASATPGAPAPLQPPTAALLGGLVEPSVPTSVMAHLPAVLAVALGGAVYSGGDLPLFSGTADRPKDLVTHAAALPPRPGGAPWEFTYDVPRWMRDVPTGIVLQDGHEDRDRRDRHGGQAGTGRRRSMR